MISIRIATLISCILIINAQDNENYDLKYSINDGHFQKLTTLKLRSIKQSQNQENSNLALVYSENLNEAFKKELNDARKSFDSILRLQLCNQDTNCVSSFVYLKDIPLKRTNNGIKLNITIHQAQSQQIINAFNINIDDNESNDYDDDRLDIRASIVSLKTPEAPETNAFLEKVRRETEVKQQSEETNNKSFLAKYWYYIVPVVILLLVSNIQNPEQGGGGA